MMAAPATEAGGPPGPWQLPAEIGRRQRGQAKRRRQESPAQALAELVPAQRCTDVFEASEELQFDGFGDRKAHERPFHIMPLSG